MPLSTLDACRLADILIVFGTSLTHTDCTRRSPRSPEKHKERERERERERCNKTTRKLCVSLEGSIRQRAAATATRHALPRQHAALAAGHAHSTPRDHAAGPAHRPGSATTVQARPAHRQVRRVASVLVSACMLVGVCVLVRGARATSPL